MRSVSLTVVLMWAACGGDSGGRADLICGAGQVPRNGFCVAADGDVFAGDAVDFDGVDARDDTRDSAQPAPDTSTTTAQDASAGDDTSATDTVPDSSMADSSASDSSMADSSTIDSAIADSDVADTSVASDTTSPTDTSPTDTSPPNPGPPCYGVPYEGCCGPNDAALFCYLGRLEAQTCYEDGCGWTGEELGYYCQGSGDDPSGHFTRACPAAAVAVACACGTDRCRPDATCGAPCPCGPDTTFVARAQVVQHLDGATSVALSDAPATPESGACDLVINPSAAPLSSSAIRLGFVPNIDSAGGCTNSTNVVATYDRWSASGERSYSDPAESIDASWSWSGSACVVTLHVGFTGGNAWSRTLTVPATPAYQCTTL